jgi:hypothetical protein
VVTVQAKQAKLAKHAQTAVYSYGATEAEVREYFSDIPVMIQIARCESAFRHTLADGSVLRGRVDNRDTGVMQINSFYHSKAAVALGLDITDLKDNMAYARSLYEKQGTQPWSASAPCWSKALAKL